MSLRLSVDGDRWRTHLRHVADTTPGLTPVLKGNGYGFGLHRLARKAGWLGVDTVAVGTYPELAEVAPRYDGDLLVLTPWRPFGPALEVDPTLARRVIHTVSRVEDIAPLLERDPQARIVLELVTSMRRHGLTRRDLEAAAEEVRRHEGVELEGVAIHLPLGHGSHLSEVRRLMTHVVAAELPTRTLWVSHLTASELERLRASYSDFEVRPRIGTSLWLGDRGALRVTASVLDVHAVDRGDVFGYRGRSMPKPGHLVVVSGGTAHGIGLEAPTGDLSIKARAATLARGGLDAVGFVRSPFSLDGKQRLFAEPPHMQASMLFLPQGARVPAVGDDVDVRVRFTATTFDAVTID
ncbi:alanine racemase [Nocardioides aestuarii]|uniref:Alanine racemase n=1 Tax=Nocardioides aestuarii TaxID=252231 RepID=A0ABW4TPH6_9ACTN